MVRQHGDPARVQVEARMPPSAREPDMINKELSKRPMLCLLCGTRFNLPVATNDRALWLAMSLGADVLRCFEWFPIFVQYFDTFRFRLI